MKETRYSAKHEATLIETNRGEDWVGYKTEDESFHGTMTLNTWNSLGVLEQFNTDLETVSVGDEEWPYEQ